MVGVNHPVISFTGSLPELATRLQTSCPPNCIHVSSRVATLCGPPSKASLDYQGSFIPRQDSVGHVFPTSPAVPEHGTYFIQAGDWAMYLDDMPQLYDQVLELSPSVINSNAQAMRPVQLALASLLTSDPATLLGLLVAMQSPAKGQSCLRHSSVEPFGPMTYSLAHSMHSLPHCSVARGSTASS